MSNLIFSLYWLKVYSLTANYKINICPEEEVQVRVLVGYTKHIIIYYGYRAENFRTGYPLSRSLNLNIHCGHL